MFGKQGFTLFLMLVGLYIPIFLCFDRLSKQKGFSLQSRLVKAGLYNYLGLLFAKNYLFGDINLIEVDADFLRQERKAGLNSPKNH